MLETTQAWHFVNSKLRDGCNIPLDGEKLVHDGELDLCASGLHASERLIDALQYAPGNTLCRVELGGEILSESDKLCASERTILWRIDAEPVLFEFSRWAALQVIHLWDAPDVVRKYLETGDKSLRAATWAAAMAAASAATWDAAWAAARAAARATAGMAAARAAAWDAARAAARAAAWDAQNNKLTEMVIAAHEMEAV